MRSAGVELSHDSPAALDLHACALAARGDAARLRRLLDAGGSARAADYDGRTLLHLAAAGGQEEVTPTAVA